MADGIRAALFSKITLLPIIILVFATIYGSVSAGGIEAEQTAELAGYFHNFFGEVPKGGSGLLLSSAKKYLLVWFLIFLSGPILPGFIINIGTVWERGFAIGYTSACFYGVYGAKGIFACLTLLPEMLVFVPILVFFSSISLKMSFFAHENKKLFLKKYFLFSIFFLTAFCVVSLFQTFLTTTFMRVISRVL